MVPFQCAWKRANFLIVFATIYPYHFLAVFTVFVALSRKHGVCIRKWRKLQGQLQGQSDTGFIWRKKEKVLDIDKLSSLLKVLIFCFLSFILAIFPSCQRSACSSFVKSLNLRHEFKQHLYYILFFFMGIETQKEIGSDFWQKKSINSSGGQTSNPERGHFFLQKGRFTVFEK